MQVETTMRLLTLVGDDLVRVAPRLIGRARESPWSMPWTGSRLAAFYFGGVEWLGVWQTASPMSRLPGRAGFLGAPVSRPGHPTDATDPPTRDARPNSGPSRRIPHAKRRRVRPGDARRRGNPVCARSRRRGRRLPVRPHGRRASSRQRGGRRRRGRTPRRPRAPTPRGATITSTAMAASAPLSRDEARRLLGRVVRPRGRPAHRERKGQ